MLNHACAVAEHAPLHLLHQESATPYPKQFGDIRDSSEWLKILIRSYANELLPDAVYSHISAALIHGFDPPFPATEPAEVVRPGFHRSKPTLKIRERMLASWETTTVGDLPVTTMRRTLPGLASDYPFEVSVPFISEALRRRWISRTALLEGIEPGRRGCRSTLQAMNLAHPGHEYCVWSNFTDSTSRG